MSGPFQGIWGSEVWDLLAQGTTPGKRGRRRRLRCVQVRRSGETLLAHLLLRLPSLAASLSADRFGLSFHRALLSPLSDYRFAYGVPGLRHSIGMG